MPHENLTYHYVHTSRQTMRQVILSMLILPAWLLVFYYLGRNQSNIDSFLRVAIITFTIIELILMGCALWLLRNPSRFEIRVSKTSFSMHDPIFTSWNFDVNPRDILSIENILSNDTKWTTIKMTLRNGEWHEICPNYRYSRKQLYAALKKHNPDIQLPKNPYRFSKKRKHPHTQ